MIVILICGVFINLGRVESWFGGTVLVFRNIGFCVIVYILYGSIQFPWVTYLSHCSRITIDDGGGFDCFWLDKRSEYIRYSTQLIMLCCWLNWYQCKKKRRDIAMNTRQKYESVKLNTCFFFIFLFVWFNFFFAQFILLRNIKHISISNIK